MIIASAVISTGPEAGRARLQCGLQRVHAPSAMRSRAKLITRMELAVATPMHMMAPVSAGTDSVVPVRNSIHTMPASAPGKPMTITAGSIQLWKLTTMSR